MSDTSAWWQSKTIWASLVGVLAGLLAVLTHNKVQILPADQEQIVTLIMSLVGIVTGILAIYGRVTANTQIGSSK
jgi:uncharacterized membrane protein HdeD (DUF308 family)